MVQQQRQATRRHQLLHASYAKLTCTRSRHRQGSKLCLTIAQHLQRHQNQRTRLSNSTARTSSSLIFVKASSSRFRKTFHLATSMREIKVHLGS
jgi:hypothetical protein